MSAVDEKYDVADHKVVSCLGWLILFGVVGFFVMTAVLSSLKSFGDKEELRQCRALMTEQIERIKRGEINCLVQPDPRLIDELMTDTACSEKIRDLYLGGDLSDPQLSRLLELPNLKCIILLFGDKSIVFFEHLKGNAKIEEITIDRTHLTRKAVDCIGSLPNLKSLCCPVEGLKPDDLQGIANHPAIEKLYLGRAENSDGLLPILQSLPRLKNVTIQILEERNPESFRESLQSALPDCKCLVNGAES
mgnify:CR=1 FL=1